jgi:hypothetical protein
MTPGDRERIRLLVKRSCAEQGIDVIVPPEVAAEVARLIAGGRLGRGGDGRAA